MSPYAAVVVLALWGDSLAQGMCQVRQGCIDMTIKGWGLTHNGWLEQAHKLRALKPGTTLVMMVGANDEISLAFEERLAYTASQIDPGVKVIWAQQPTYCDRPDLDMKANWISGDMWNLAKVTHQWTVEAAKFTFCDESRATDGVHFSPDGYRGMLQGILTRAYQPK